MQTPRSSPADAEVTVLVVGAGPTGLMAALVLTRLGVPVTIVDPKHGPTRESRALAVQARTMEIWDQLGIVEQALDQATTAVRMRPGVGRRPGRTTVDVAGLQTGRTPFPGLHVLEQSRTEALLVTALREAGTTVAWGHRLLHLGPRSDGADGVEAVIETGDGLLVRRRARWCVGADGAGSLVRRLLDVPFTGVTDRPRFWVADVRGAHGLDADTVELRLGGDDLLLAFPLGSGHHRLIGMVHQQGEPQAEAVLDRTRAVFGVDHAEVVWFSHYRVHHRVADSFRRGGCFLAGDAAHVHSPVGGQGMNTGLQDAHHLACALADVHHGRAGEDSLERYEAERRPVAQHLVSITDRAFSTVSSPGLRGRVVRERVAPRVFPVVARLTRSDAGARLGDYLGQYRIRYPVAGAHDPAVGRRLRPTETNRAVLRSLGWQLHHYGPDALPRPDGLPGWVEGVHPFGPQDGLDPGRLYLVRPDGFVAAACAPTTPAVVDALRGAGLRV